jgi:GH25 family lysozyme M1 (1,4-beta-N-acetylmuramidase)
LKPFTSLVIDIWEGSLEINEPVLKAAGVAGFIIRLNNMVGGHHKDKEFDRQWREAAAFARAPYFVYNPWVNGQQNFDWLAANCPAEARTVFVDIEVRYDGYAPATYAAEVGRFLALAEKRWRVPVYTGQGFADILSVWPRGEYWWAQYPTSIPWATLKTWDELKVALDKLDLPYNKQFIPGLLRLWQCSGDKVVLPGTQRTTDINIFYGTESELRAWFGEVGSAPPLPMGDLAERVTALEVWAKSYK